MSDHVKIASATLIKVRAKLEKFASLEKRAAQLESDNRIYRETMELVAGGFLDPGVAIEKVAEFQEDPIRLDILKAALDLGPLDTTKLGTAVDDTDRTLAEAGTPEAKLSRRIETISDDLDLRNS